MFNANAYIPMSNKMAEQAVDVAQLSTNYIDIISDCGGIEGFDPKNGARPLRRKIEEEVESLLSEELIKENLKKA